MAELALVRISLKLVWGLIANRAIARLETGNPTDEKLRQLLLSEFRKLHEELDALRRKELVAATAFMENAYEILNDDPGEAIKEFNKARDAAQVALGVVKELHDKILATKIMIASAIHEFVDKPDVAASLCMKYVSRLNSLPMVANASCAQISPRMGTKWRWGGSEARQELLGKISEINRCVRHFVTDQTSGIKYLESDCSHINVEGRLVNPVTDFILLRSCMELTALKEGFGTPICMVVVESKMFFAQTQAAVSGKRDAFLGNAIKALDLETGSVSQLVGHAGVVLCLAVAGSHLVSGSFDKNILIWDANSCKCVHILTGHEGSVRSLAVNDSHIFSGSTDCTIKVWDSITFQLHHTLEGHSAPVTALAVSNRHLFSAEVSGPIKYWDLKKFTCLHDIKSPGNISKMHILNSNLLVAFDQKLSVINLGNLREVAITKHPAELALIIDRNLCTASESTLSSLDVHNMNIIGLKAFKDSDVLYNIKCMHYEEMTGYLYVTALCTTANSKEKYVVFRL
ncbi:uncharacterized protein LOC111327057 [Stylophora pistillata]|uniref:Myosin heavy chain kinase B n=1 Tax=Stylophora pistillata TaxID=50429 RepID=A0A2B4SEN3_STYPI|nr:uncharacterized protein LOC111327057 [Stylophora pistillata]PFX27836.1 Myosin heavy chain kinase B [Stylophora pistillata]